MNAPMSTSGSNGVRRLISGLVLLAGVAVVALGGSASASPAETAAEVQPYPLDVCIVSGQSLDAMGGPVVHQHEGREVKFCCDGCVATFKADPAGYFKKVDEAVMAGQRAAYPLEQCLVSGKPLTEAKKVVEFLQDSRLVRVCSEQCRDAVAADPETYSAKLDAAVITKQLPDYPLDVCVVSGMKLGGMGEPVNHLHEGRLVRFCCAGCLPAFEKDPAPYLKKIDAAVSQ